MLICDISNYLLVSVDQLFTWCLISLNASRWTYSELLLSCLVLKSYMAGLSVNGVLSKREKTLILLALLNALLSSTPTALGSNDLCVELISPLGYACNAHSVETSDGFVLGIYNIPYGRAGPSATAGAPVLLFHGYQAGGENYVENPPDESLATVMADAGFDVWIGNNRNVQWSHGSSKYVETDKGYWDWTWDELAAYDIPASIDFIYNARKGTQVFYVGHSQGALTLIAALTNTAAATAKVTSQLKGAVLLAPIAYNTYITAPLMKILLTTFIDELPVLLGSGALNVTSQVQKLCNDNNSPGCRDLLRGLLGPDSHINDTRRSFYSQYFPQLTSSKNFNHFGQTFRSGKFQKYDMGPISNFLRYGQFSPPQYDWSLFPEALPVQVYYGGIDGLADTTDIQRAISSLPSTSTEAYALPSYGHVDFVLGETAYLDLYPNIISFFRTH